MQKLCRFINQKLLTPKVFIPLFLLSTFFNFSSVYIKFAPLTLLPFGLVVAFKQLKHQGKSLPKSLWLLLGLYVLLAVAHIFLGKGTEPWRERAFILLFSHSSIYATPFVLVHLFILFTVFYLPNSKLEVQGIFKLITWVMFVVTFVSVILFLNHQFLALSSGIKLIPLAPTDEYRFSIFYHLHPNQASILLAIFSSVAIHLGIITSKKILKPIYIIISFFFAFALLLTQSRTTIIFFFGFAFLFTLFQVLSFRKTNPKLFKWLVLVCLGSTALFVFFALPFLAKKLTYFQTFFEHLKTLTFRTIIWKRTFHAIFKTPISLLIGHLGLGIQNFSLVHLGLLGGGTHNSWLNILVINGVVALLIFAFFMLKSYVKAVCYYVKSSNKAHIAPIMVAIFTILGSSLMESFLLYVPYTSNFLFFLLLGYINLHLKSSTKFRRNTMNFNIMNVDTVNLDEQHKRLLIINQTKLPNEVEILSLRNQEDIWQAIYLLQVRGAPAIGVAAAMGLYLASLDIKTTNTQTFMEELKKAKDYLASSRPTAVNLFWALNRMYAVAENHQQLPVESIQELLHKEALAIRDEDIWVCKSIGEYGLTLIQDGMGILTHCNAGQLATVKYGTALAPIHLGREKGMNFKVFCDETRPLLQGARLSSFELVSNGVDTTVICDNMASQVMKNGWVQAVFVGCDRVAANGDAANKIGTSGVAILAKHYGIPFYVCAPTSTIDMDICTGKDIPIEERKPSEVSDMWYKKTMTPKGAKIYNPAFDVTDNQLITAIITEYGIAKAPYTESLKNIFKIKEQAQNH